MLDGASARTSVVVVGDVNSTLACALVAAKLGISRSPTSRPACAASTARCRRRSTGIVTDGCRDLLFTPSPDADENLRREGIPDDRIQFVGNVMIDTLLAHRRRALARRRDVRHRARRRRRTTRVLTLHRPSNVDDRRSLGDTRRARSPSVGATAARSSSPSTRGRASALDGRARTLARRTDVRVVEPLGYLDFLALIAGARLVLTDSGGIQEETTVLGVPCLTLRENTERPVTITAGHERVVGVDPEAHRRGRIPRARPTASSVGGPRCGTATPATASPT